MVQRRITTTASGVGSCWLLAICLTGCQSVDPATSTTQAKRESFSKLWKLYEQCRAKQDLEAVLAQEAPLAREAALNNQPQEDFPNPMMNDKTYQQPLRVVVDPKALAADCTLRAAGLAAQEGRLSKAKDLYAAVLHRYPESVYALYTDRARHGLAHLDQMLAFPSTRPFPPQ